MILSPAFLFLAPEARLRHCAAETSRRFSRAFHEISARRECTRCARSGSSRISRPHGLVGSGGTVPRLGNLLHHRARVCQDSGAGSCLWAHDRSGTDVAASTENGSGHAVHVYLRRSRHLPSAFLGQGRKADNRRPPGATGKRKWGNSRDPGRKNPGSLLHSLELSA